MSDVHKIVVALSTSDVVIEPGNVAQVVVTLTNQQETADRLAIEVEGVDVEWYAIPVPAVNVAAGAQVSERVLFKVARNSANKAGSYPFLVRVQAMETGEVGLAQATLTLKPYNSLQVEMDHKRAVATFFHPLNDFDVSITNLGNAEETVNLYASDSDDGCAFEFDTDRITLKPGQTETVPLAVRPKVSSVLGGARLYSFTVSARSVDDSYVSANVAGQIETHALISPLLGLFALLLALGAGAYFYFKPAPQVPPKINHFTASQSKIIDGQTIQISWDVSGANPQILIAHHIKNKDGQASDDVMDGQQSSAVGNITVTPQTPTTIYTLVVRGAGKELTHNLTIEVTPKPPPHKPVIKSLTAEPSKIHLGDSVTIIWDTLYADKLILDPDALTLSKFEQNHKVTPQDTTTYTLRAIGEDGVSVVSKSVTVKAYPKDQTLAEIPLFSVKEKTVYIGDTVHLQWKTLFAHTVHLSADNGIVDVDVNHNGGKEVKIDAPTTFTLKAIDSAGLAFTKQITITPQEKPAPPITPDSVPPPGGTISPTPPITGNSGQ